MLELEPLYNDFICIERFRYVHSENLGTLHKVQVEGSSYLDRNMKSWQSVQCKTNDKTLILLESLCHISQKEITYPFSHR